MGKNKRRSALKIDLWKNILTAPENYFFIEIWKRALSTKTHDICWCGSGKKYKDCHFDRSGKPPFRIYEYIKVLRKAYNKGYCLHPEAGASTCSGLIIHAHTIQKNGGLSRIARESHVYTFLSQKSLTKEIAASPNLISINKASTFSGFCSFHDNKTFEPIEIQPFESRSEHAFLLAYRTLCHEIFKKRINVEITTPFQLENLDKGKSLEDQIVIQYSLSAFRTSSALGLNDLLFYQKKYNLCLTSKDFSEVYYYIIHFDVVPDFLCSSLFAPEYDFSGNALQNLANTSVRPEHCTFSLIVTEQIGAAVFCWVGKSGANEKFIKSLHALSNQEIPHAIVRLTFEHFEDVFAKPGWWESLGEIARAKLLQRQVSGSLHSERTAHCLVDDGLKMVKWQVVSRQTNFSVLS